MASTKIDKIVIECTCPTSLTQDKWDKHLRSIEMEFNQIKNSMRYKVYRMAPKP